jgi:hypothetical protein
MALYYPSWLTKSYGNMILDDYVRKNIKESDSDLCGK